MLLNRLEVEQIAVNQGSLTLEVIELENQIEILKLTKQHLDKKIEWLHKLSTMSKKEIISLCEKMDAYDSMVLKYAKVIDERDGLQALVGTLSHQLEYITSKTTKPNLWLTLTFNKLSEFNT